ncbi:putative disease resistance protein RGA1 [Coffea eugenioides]|uniref:putative disease resistance protein RGA1 n=1 Tax=Coffea eugenioides TaxID=49369 RepID=UPI000F6137BA|nr:putative disease resistance protein RGA1 [Coffea eugenioides]
MAELLVPKVIDVLGDVVVKQLGEKVNLVMGVEEEVANIKKSLETIQEVLHDAERRRVKERPVGKWLEELEDITYEMDDVLDEWNVKILKPENEGTYRNARMQPTLGNKVRSFIPSLCSCLKQLPVRSDIASKLKKINEELELTFEKACQFEFISSSGIPDSQDFQRIMTTSIIDESEIYGRESDKDALLDQVLSKSTSQGRDGVQVISVVGVGGSGKTTLAQLLFNNDEVKNHFELRNWVCVSDPFARKTVAKAILENAGKSSHDAELDRLIRRIKETFSCKRFLDDVWTEDDSKWKPFQYSLKDGAPRSVILVTTRSHRVATVVGSTDTHHLSLISDSDCWLIMQRIAFGGRSGDLCKKVEIIGQKIAEKCNGLPLAAKTMGSLLRFKDTVQQWQKSLDLPTSPWNLINIYAYGRLRHKTLL